MASIEDWPKEAEMGRCQAPQSIFGTLHRIDCNSETVAKICRHRQSGPMKHEKKLHVRSKLAIGLKKVIHAEAVSVRFDTLVAGEECLFANQ
jgi:hypothetical protein